MRFGEYPPAWSATEEVRHESPAAGEADRAMPPEHPTGLEAELGALAALGFSKPTLARSLRQAQSNGTSVEKELLSGNVDEDAYYGAIARLLRLPFIRGIDPAHVTDCLGLDTQLQRPTMLRIAYPHAAPQIAVVPEAGRLADIAAALATMPLLGRDLAITTPSAIRSAVWSAGAERRARDTTNHLFEHSPRLSARIVLSGRQGFYAGLLVAALLSAFVVHPVDTLLSLHIFLSMIYFASLALRLTALLRKARASPTQQEYPRLSGPLPRYTVMVALYREAGIARQLVSSLRRLDWPTSLLDIKLVCEADDRETIAALKAQALGSEFEIVEVPPLGPRTKPKALTYALAAACGEFLAIYDAEDRPHPQQLREAYARFRAAPPDLACLQAPLIITNARASWLSALFSLEYSALFRGVLPMLGRSRMPLPLGGTSNHFRTDVLRQAGGWDPFNVTEDADMGLRLYRLGYRADVLQRQTLEDAPESLSIWTAQRSRWFKGWLQTWLVLMRDPQRLVREMGFAPFLTFQLMVGGMLLSSLLHPLIVVFLGLGAFSMFQVPARDIPLHVLSLFIIDFVNILGSYLIFLGLGIGSMIDHEKRLVGWRWTAVPLYWLMTSFAAWRAVIELKRKPFFWNKTPHKPVASSRS
jgi:cellulose synthase/poly-beta-1,6-N-acetylglucosamine synthase-like glycosyltransferase